MKKLISLPLIPIHQLQKYIKAPFDSDPQMVLKTISQWIKHPYSGLTNINQIELDDRLKDQPYPLVHLLVKYGKINLLKQCVEIFNLDLTTTDFMGNSILHRLAMTQRWSQSHYDIFKFICRQLLEQNSLTIIQQVNKCGESPLELSIKRSTLNVYLLWSLISLTPDNDSIFTLTLNNGGTLFDALFRKSQSTILITQTCMMMFLKQNKQINCYNLNIAHDIIREIQSLNANTNLEKYFEDAFSYHYDGNSVIDTELTPSPLIKNIPSNPLPRLNDWKTHLQENL